MTISFHLTIATLFFLLLLCVRTCPEKKHPPWDLYPATMEHHHGTTSWNTIAKQHHGTLPWTPGGTRSRTRRERDRDRRRRRYNNPPLPTKNTRSRTIGHFYAMTLYCRFLVVRGGLFDSLFAVVPVLPYFKVEHTLACFHEWVQAQAYPRFRFGCSSVVDEVKSMCLFERKSLFFGPFWTSRARRRWLWCLLSTTL